MHYFAKNYSSKCLTIVPVVELLNSRSPRGNPEFCHKPFRCTMYRWSLTITLIECSRGGHKIGDEKRKQINSIDTIRWNDHVASGNCRYDTSNMLRMCNEAYLVERKDKHKSCRKYTLCPAVYYDRRLDKTKIYIISTGRQQVWWTMH